jgi:predicted amino acid dehydrogenase
MRIPPLSKKNAVPIKTLGGVAVSPVSRRILACIPEPERNVIAEKAEQLARENNVTGLAVSEQFLRRIQAGKIDLNKVSETDWRAAVQPRSIAKGNVLDLDTLLAVKRGPAEVISNILGGWLRLLFPNFDQGKYDYAFMVHPRNYADVLRGVPFLKYIPDEWGRALVKRLPPFKLSDMTGIKAVDGKDLTGALVCIGWDREMFESSPRWREMKIADMVKLIRNMGIKYAGFAALLPWASRYGQCLEGTVPRSEIFRIVGEKEIAWDRLKELFVNPDELNLVPKPLTEVKPLIAALPVSKGQKKKLVALFSWATGVKNDLQEMVITTGHPFTVAIINSFVRKVVELHPKEDPLIAVVGAAGSTGSCVLKKLAAERLNNFLLIDRVKSAGVVDMDQLVQEMSGLNPALKADASTDLSRLQEADIVIVVSSAAGTIVGSEHLKPGAIVIDDSQPRNVDEKLAKQRPDIRIITVLAPIDGLIPNFYFDRHTPFTGACFTCAGDVSLRRRTNTPVRATGPAELDGVNIIEEMARQTRERIGFDPLRPVFYTYDRQVIPFAEIEQIAALTLKK